MSNTPYEISFRERFHAEAYTELMSRQYAEPDLQPAICREFGCGKRLTLEELLCGNLCPKHQKEAPEDVTLRISL